MIPIVFLIFSLDQPAAAVRMYFLIFSFAAFRHLVLRLHAIEPFKLCNVKHFQFIEFNLKKIHLSLCCFKWT